MAIGKHLKIQRLGDAVLGVRLLGDPKKPEPIHFRIYLPFGDVDIVRTTDNDYWVHIRKNEVDDTHGSHGVKEGHFVCGRLDVKGQHVSETDFGDFSNPGLNHLAVRLGPKEQTHGK